MSSAESEVVNGDVGRLKRRAAFWPAKSAGDICGKSSAEKPAGSAVRSCGRQNCRTAIRPVSTISRPRLLVTDHVYTTSAEGFGVT